MTTKRLSSKTKIKKKRPLETADVAPKKKKKGVKKVSKVVEPPVKEFKAGKAAEHSDTINCLGCMRWQECPSKRKNFNYACTKFKEFPVKSKSSARDLKSKGPHMFTTTGAVDPDEGLTKEERIISEMITRTLSGSGVIASDARIDDRDIPTAPNYYTWVTDSRFAGKIFVPWAKQIEHPTKLLSEWCPSPKCTDLKWWANTPVDATPGEFLDRVSFLEFGKCPTCGTTKSEWMAQGKLNNYTALAGLAGQRLSKTFTSVITSSYNLHRLLKSQNPAVMYGVPSSQVLTGTFAALTFDQAKENIWTTMQNVLQDATWFSDYHALLKEQSYRYGIEDVASVTNIAARYRHRNLFYHITGPNKRTLRGRTRCEAMVDEIGWFTVGKTKGGSDPERLDADGLHEALDRSLLTVREAASQLIRSGTNENVPSGLLYEVSSPSAKNDMIMRRYEASLQSKSIYGYRMATWEGNPGLGRNSETIAEAFRDDPIKAMRDYGAVPPVTSSPFVKLESLKKLFSARRENAGLLKSVIITNRAGEPQTTGRVKRFKAHNGEPSVLSIDAGSVNNSFAVTILYRSPTTGRVICPFISEIFPSHEAPIHFPDLSANLLSELIVHFNVGLVMCDRWNSIMLLQELMEEHGVGVMQRSIKYPDFDNFRQMGIYDGELQMPMLECEKPKDAIKIAAKPGYPKTFNAQPLSHLLYQLVAVNDIPGVTVAKPDAGTDDLLRSLVLGFTAINDTDYAEYFEHAVAQPPQHIGVMVNAIGGIGVGASTSNSIGVARSPGSSGGASSPMGVVARRN